MHHLDLDLPPSKSDARRRLVVQAAEGVSGILEQEGSRLALSEFHADTLLLDALQLMFGKVGLTEKTHSAFHGVEGSFVQDGERVELDVKCQRVQARLLGVDTRTIAVKGKIVVDGLRLRVDDSGGLIEADELRVTEFEFSWAEADIAAADLTIRNLSIGWGSDGFRLEAESTVAPGIHLALGPLELTGEDLDVSRFALRAGELSVASAVLGRASVGAALSNESQANESQAQKANGGQTEDEQTESPAEEQNNVLRTRRDKLDGLDFGLFDGLSGEVQADVSVELGVPLIGSRHAVHRFRLPIREGAINYLEVEGGLSTFESILFDFAVRDDSLTLERGIPLLPTRGHGKPLLVWDLDEQDLALAEQHRIRLAVLPRARTTGEGELEVSDTVDQSLSHDLVPAKESKEPPQRKLTLRRMGLDNVDVCLKLDAREQPIAFLRRLAFGSLRVRGGVEYAAEGAGGEGALQLEVTALDTSIADLPLGSKKLCLDKLRVEEVADARAQFQGLSPQEVRFDISKLKMQDIALTSATS